MKHLSSDEITAYLIGDRAPEQQQHVRECAECRTEIERVERPLAWFGSAVKHAASEYDAVKNWSDQQAESWSGSRRPDQSLHGGSRWRSLRLPSAVAATVLFALAAVPIYRSLQPDRAAESRRSTVPDAVLLEQVEAGIARAVPQPLEPLSRLMNGEEVQRRPQ